jgi:thiol-disulfide isomerase/thioredoxin
MFFLLCSLSVTHLTFAAIPATEDVVENEKTCLQLDADSFATFVAEHKIAMFQVHNGVEILTSEIREALSRITIEVGYAVIDASLDSNKDLIAKLDRNEQDAAEFFIFRNGLPFNKIRRLRKGLSADAVEEILVFLDAQETAIEDTNAEANAQNGDQDSRDFPSWSIRKQGDVFQEIFKSEDFDAIMAKAVSTQLTVVQFFSRACNYCQIFSYDWHQSSRYYAEVLNVDFIRVDGNAVENQEILTRYGIKGFPTIKFFIGDKYESTFTKERKASILNEEINAILSTASKKARNKDGSINIKAHLPALLRNLEMLYESGSISETSYLNRLHRLQGSSTVSE